MNVHSIFHTKIQFITNSHYPQRDPFWLNKVQFSMSKSILSCLEHTEQKHNLLDSFNQKYINNKNSLNILRTCEHEFQKNDCLARHCNLLIHIIFRRAVQKAHKQCRKQTQTENKIQPHHPVKSTTHQTKKQRKKQLPKISTNQQQSKTQL